MKTLKKNDLVVELDLNGAWIKSFDKGDKHVFFPYKEMEIEGVHKKRGGMHICAPNFGPDEILGELAQHGYGRDLEWEVLEESENSIKLELKGQGAYEKVRFLLTYLLEDDRLITEFIASNEGEETRLLNPGFHPYFYTKDCNIEVEDFEVIRDELPLPMTDDNESETIKTSEFDIEIKGHEGVGKYIIWTDFGDDYVCVEPTYNGMSFRENDDKPYELNSQESFIQKFEIIIK